MIAGLLAIHAAALYVIWWLVMLSVRFVPIVGVKHKHRDWDRLNSDGPVTTEPPEGFTVTSR